MVTRFVIRHIFAFILEKYMLEISRFQILFRKKININGCWSNRLVFQILFAISLRLKVTSCVLLTLSSLISVNGLLLPLHTDNVTEFYNELMFCMFFEIEYNIKIARKNNFDLSVGRKSKSNN